MTYNNQAAFDVLRSVDGSSITGSYAALGAPLSLPALVVAFKNETDGDVVVSTNGTDDNLIFPANSYGIYDIRTNAPSSLNYMFAEGTQFYAKGGVSSPSMGAFYMEAVIAQQVT